MSDMEEHDHESSCVWDEERIKQLENNNELILSSITRIEAQLEDLKRKFEKQLLRVLRTKNILSEGD